MYSYRLPNNPKSTVEWHWDGFSYRTQYMSGSIRLSNIPTNFDRLLSWGFSTMIGSFFLNYHTAEAKLFSIQPTQNGTHYVFGFSSSNIENLHLWNILLENNHCNLSDIHDLSNWYGYVLKNSHLSINDYKYDKIAEWNLAVLWRRWLEPASEEFEFCFKTIMDLSTKVEPENGDNSLLLGAAAAGLLITGYAAKQLFFKQNSPTRPALVHPTHSERLERLHNPKVPEKFLCPISKEIMNDPVILDDGHSYERASIEQLLRSNRFAKCPLDSTKQIRRDPPTNLYLKNEIDTFLMDLENQETLKRGDRRSTTNHF